MSKEKKQIRNAFNLACLKRDKYQCKKCGKKADKDNWKETLDVHHIQDRSLIPEGSIKENGICLCFECHEKAEQFHRTGTPFPGYSVNELYEIIGSSYETVNRIVYGQ